jgi:hypothetical protein
MRGSPQLPSVIKPTHQLNLTFGPRPLSGLSTTDRSRSIALLAYLLYTVSDAQQWIIDDAVAHAVVIGVFVNPSRSFAPPGSRLLQI